MPPTATARRRSTTPRVSTCPTARTPTGHDMFTLDGCRRVRPAARRRVRPLAAGDTFIDRRPDVRVRHAVRPSPRATSPSRWPTQHADDVVAGALRTAIQGQYTLGNTSRRALPVRERHGHPDATTVRRQSAPGCVHQRRGHHRRRYGLGRHRKARSPRARRRLTAHGIDDARHDHAELGRQLHAGRCGSRPSVVSPRRRRR